MKREYDLVPPEFDAAKNYVRQNEQKLRAKYGENFIAVLGSSGVIDYDKSRSTLVDRLGERTHTKINPLVETIDDILNSGVIEIDSPEIVA